MLFRLNLFSALSLAAGVSAAEPELSSADLPRVPATAPAEAYKTFTLREGYRLELAAHEPNVVDPIAVAFDEDARMYVIEMRDYSERRDEQLGRVRLLEDADNDGIYEKSTVFAENLPWPTAIICYNGGVFVGATPDILYLKDKDNDGRADEKKVVFTGFAKQQSRLNVQQLMNSFHWGLDNRIHGSSSSNGGTIEQPASKQPAVNIGARDFSFDPRALTIRAESGGGQHGMSFDNFGRKFVSQNSSHIRQVVYEDRYLRAEIPFQLPAPAIDIPADGPAAEVFRTSPEEPWRRIRTQWRLAGTVSGPIEGGGRSAGYFTGATGVHVYRGDACPDLVGNAFIGDAGGNLVHRKLLKPNGVLFVAERPNDERNREFLASRDNWFRPVQFADAPDGSLYVIDMYREVIEHPWSLPANIKKHLDLNSGNDRGRIWRIVPKDFQRRSQQKFSKATAEELAFALAHANGWHRDTASRLLYERQDASASEYISKLAAANIRVRPVGAVHALNALAGTRNVKVADIETAFHDLAAPEVVEHGVRLIETLSPQDQAEAAQSIPVLSIHPRVLHQIAWTVGALDITFKYRIIGALALNRFAIQDPWIRSALLVSSMGDKDRVWQLVTQRPDFFKLPGASEFLTPLAKTISPDLLAKTLARFEKSTNKADAFLVASAVSEPLRNSPALKPFIEQAANDLSSPAALRLLRAGDPERARPALTKLFASSTNEAVRLEAFRGLAANPKEAAKILFDAWPSLPTRLRQSALDAVLSAKDGANLAIAALREKKVTRSDLSASQIQTLRQHPDPAISRPALELLGKVDADRAAVLDKLRPALALEGDAKAGAATYELRCASCHRLAGKGTAIGPDLESVRANGREYLLTHLIDPNREVAARFVAYDAEIDGETITGLLTAETDDSVTIQPATGEAKTIPRSKLTKLRGSANSLMPIGLEEALTPQQVADLLSYIQTAQP